MKLAWVNDLDPMVEVGGAQLNDRAMILEGLRRGHDIRIVLPGKNPHDMADVDLAIISRCVGMGVSGYDELTTAEVPFMFFHHDYAPQLCRWALFYPMEERCKTLCYLRDRWRPVLERAAKHIWLSPLHRWAWLFAYPNLKQRPFALVPSAVDPTLFPSRGRYPATGPPGGVIAVESGALFKGWENVKAWAEAHPDTDITLVGGAPESAPPPNVKHVGYVPNQLLGELYRAHDTFLHLPGTPMPFERTIAEAYLSGCRIIANRNVGALSYSWARPGRARWAYELGRAPLRFWKAVEGAAKP